MKAFQVIAVKTFDGAAIIGKEYTVSDMSDDGKVWYKVQGTENGYTWVPAHVYKVKE